MRYKKFYYVLTVWFEGRYIKYFINSRNLNEDMWQTVNE